MEIAKELVRRIDGVLFALAGDGPEKGRIEELVRKYGLEDRFVMRGFVGDMDSFYRGLDLYVNTSLHEGNPMTVLEAMAHGLPVIIPPRGGMREIVDDGIQGYLVSNRSPKEFADKCEQLYRDRESAKRMGIAGREKVLKQFSCEKMARSYSELYRDIVENH